MKKYRKIALFMAICLIVTSVTAFPKSASALSREMAFSNPEREGTFWVEGGEYSSNCRVLYSTTAATTMINVNIAETHIRNDGTVWFLYDNILEYYNFYASGATQLTEISAVAIYDDSSGNAYCYKTPSGEYYYLPSFEGLKNKNYATEKVAAGDIPKEPTPTQRPSATSKPTPTQTPDSGVSKPGGIDTIVVIYPTQKPQNTPTPHESGTPKTKVAKSGSSVKVTQDGKVISKVTFNNKEGNGYL